MRRRTVEPPRENFGHFFMQPPHIGETHPRDISRDQLIDHTERGRLVEIELDEADRFPEAVALIQEPRKRERRQGHERRMRAGMFARRFDGAAQNIFHLTGLTNPDQAD